MKKSLEEIKIFAYLAPHPLDENSNTEPESLDWIPGFINDDDVDEGTPSIYRDCNIEIYKKIESLTEQYLKDSVRNIWPLLSEIYINSMQVVIDITGIISPGSSSLAGFIHGKSNLTNGDYTFQLDFNLLDTYLKKDKNNEPLDFHEKSVWEHELIHLLDLMSLTEASLYRASNSPYENFKYYIIKYREEGIAELYYVLNGHSNIKNMQEAIELFKDRVITKKNIFDFSIANTYKTKNELYKGIDFYTIGPWIILEILREIEIDWEEDMVTNSLEIISNKEAVPLETILKIIKKAISISPIQFLKHVEKYFEEGFIPLI